MQILYTTFKTKKDAAKFAKILIKKSLAKCCNYYKVQSIYKWDKKIYNESEWILEAKAKNILHAYRFLEKNHPYKCPMLYYVNIKNISKKYARWLGEKNEDIL
jgi:periplasmic divalent cation tolerance protein